MIERGRGCSSSFFHAKEEGKGKMPANGENKQQSQTASLDATTQKTPLLALYKNSNSCPCMSLITVDDGRNKKMQSEKGETGKGKGARAI
jgi:hypothetical protein